MHVCVHGHGAPTHVLSESPFWTCGLLYFNAEMYTGSLCLWRSMFSLFFYSLYLSLSLIPQNSQIKPAFYFTVHLLLKFFSERKATDLEGLGEV